jgi:hypothetical protein
LAGWYKRIGQRFVFGGPGVFAHFSSRGAEEADGFVAFEEIE